jgi:hypothetical protein
MILVVRFECSSSVKIEACQSSNFPISFYGFFWASGTWRQAQGMNLAAVGVLVMSLGLSRLALASMLALSAASCAYNDYVDNRVARYDISAERARDEMILTNIIRASLAEPLAFVQLGQVTGVNTTSTTIGLPSLVLGPSLPTSAARTVQAQSVFGADAGTSGFTANSGTISGSTTFNVTPSESKDFYRGLRTTVEPDTLAFFTQQGIARELLFYLFTDKIIEEKGGVVHQLRNDPLDPNFKYFQHYVELAMDYGLSSEQDPTAKPAAAKSNKGKDGAADASTSSPAPKWRLCFDKTYRKAELPAAGNTPSCGTKQKLADDRMVTFLDKSGATVKLQVLPRSTFAIFQFLGHIVAAQESGGIKLQSPEAIGNAPLVDDQLFVVNEGSGSGCFLSVNYAGRNYCVPQEGARNTKRILGLLAQLIALNTSLQAIPITQQVQVLR